MKPEYQSWGHYPKAEQQSILPLRWISEVPNLKKIQGKVLPYGRGRSYGDSCLNEGGTLLACSSLDRFISFDAASGLLRCEAGVGLDQVLELALPQGWFLPVSPGTKFVTVAGAIANDIHGKNHHRAGTFGRHVRAFELLRSDGRRLLCSSHSNPALFHATIGGLGLTGLITWAEIQLKKVPGPAIAMESLKFDGLDGYYRAVSESDRDWEYTVAWVDCRAKGRALGRGHFLRGHHAAAPARPPRRQSRMPFALPGLVLGGPFMRLVNAVYYHRQWRGRAAATVHYEPFFYPLDGIRDWNRAYGRGFLQWQCVVPFGKGEEAIRGILEATAAAGKGSLVAVLKTFGRVASPGLLSFPMPGLTLALDFPNEGPALFGFLDHLDHLVLDAGGRIYPAKDARMSGASFRKFFPQWRKFQAFIDPKFSSSFWRRVTA
jgi:FAD/FMN-containing dehydrogenase